MGVAVISLISSSFFSIMVFMASSADSLALSFSAHLHSTQDLVRCILQNCTHSHRDKNLMSCYELHHETSSAACIKKAIDVPSAAYRKPRPCPAISLFAHLDTWNAVLNGQFAYGEAFWP